MVVPPVLRNGSRLAVFSPSGNVKAQDLQKGLKFLKAWGFEIHVPHEVWDKCRYLAGKDHERAVLLARLWQDNFDILWASRGGYGALRILPFLDELLEPPSKPIWVLGFSDVTILLNYFWHRFGLVSLHAPVICSLNQTGICALAALKRTLFQKRPPRLEGKTLNYGEAKGVLIGGNLSSFVSLLGTPWFPELKGKILLLEDINEDLYRLDRLFTQLRCAGAFSKIKGLILGNFGPVEKWALWELARECFEGPILADLPVGHHINNYPLFIGLPSFLFAGEKAGFLEQEIP